MSLKYFLVTPIQNIPAYLNFASRAYFYGSNDLGKDIILEFLVIANYKR